MFLGVRACLRVFVRAAASLDHVTGVGSGAAAAVRTQQAVDVGGVVGGEIPHDGSTLQTHAGSISGRPPAGTSTLSHRNHRDGGVPAAPSILLNFMFSHATAAMFNINKCIDSHRASEQAPPPSERPALTCPDGLCGPSCWETWSVCLGRPDSSGGRASATQSLS